LLVKSDGRSKELLGKISMDLKSFIKESLVQIAAGIQEADTEVHKFGGAVNPRDVITNEKEDRPYGFYVEDANGSYRRPVESISFDVVVTVREGSETKGGIGVHVGAIAVGSAGKSAKASDSESRIQFTVPLMMPVSKNA
jgi:hypothetical protein